MDTPFWNTVGIWAGVILTFSVFSFLWKENMAFRIAEHLFVGLAAAYTVVNTWHNYLKPILQNDLAVEGRYGFILLMLVGLMIYTRLSRRLIWMSRIPIALEIGYTVGYSLALNPRTYLRNLNASFINIFVKDGDKIVWTQSANQLLFALMIIAVLSYFLFTMKTNKGVLSYPTAVGRWTMMIAFGAAFGGTVMARVALLIGRLQFLLGNWLHIIEV